MRKNWGICVLLILVFAIFAIAFVPQSLSYAQDEPIFEGAGNSTNSPYIIDSAEKLYAISQAANNKGTIKVNVKGTIIDKDVDENNYYRVTSDIDMSEYTDFVGIGTQDNPFSARLFDGGGYTITLNINATSDNVGLFGYYATTTKWINTIKDINVKGKIQSTKDNVGVFGYADFRLRKVTVTGIKADALIKGANNVGLIGYLNTGATDSAIDSSYNTGLTYGEDCVGGIIGYKDFSANDFFVTNCVVLGNVSGNKTGGIVGCIQQGSYANGAYQINKVHLNNNFVMGAVVGTNAGAIVGLADENLALYTDSENKYSDYIQNNYYLCTDIVNKGLFASSNLGNFEYLDNIGAIAVTAESVENVSSYSQVFLTKYSLDTGFPMLVAYPLQKKTQGLNYLEIKGGIQDYKLFSKELDYVDYLYVGFCLELVFEYDNQTGKEIEFVLNGNTISIPKEGSVYTLVYSEFAEILQDKEQVLSLVINGGERVYSLISNFSFDKGIVGTAITEGYGTVEYPYLISNEEQLKVVSDYPSFAYKLTDNIALNGLWQPLGSSANPFCGVFMGEGYEISNIKITSGSYLGLFGYTDNAIIKDLTISVNIKGNTNVGGLIGYSKNTEVIGARVFGRVEATSNAGGVVGTMYNTLAVNYTDIINYADVYCANKCGGIVGMFDSRTSRIYMTRVYQAGQVGMNLERETNTDFVLLSYNYFGLFYGYQIKAGAESLIEMSNCGAMFEVYIKGSYTDIGIFNANKGYEILGERVEGDYSVLTIRALFNGSLGTDAYIHYGCLSNYGGQFLRIAKPDNTYVYASMLDRTRATFNRDIYIDLQNITSYDMGQLADLDIVNIDNKDYVAVDTASEFEHLAWIINGYIYGENVAGIVYENIESHSVYAVRNVAQVSIMLNNDIDLTQSTGVYGENNFYGIGWASLMPYLGSIEGANHSVILNINCPYGYQIGLLGAVSSNAGGVSATASISKVSNLTVLGTIIGHTMVGLVGIHDNYAPSLMFNHDRNSTIVIHNITNYATVQGVNIVGGLIGISQSTEVLGESAKTPESFRPIRAIITESCNYGEVYASGNYGAGGLLGSTGIAVASGVRLENSANYGEIYSRLYAGGLVGRATCHIELRGSNYNYGYVSGEEFVGGLAGYIELGVKIDADKYGISGNFVNHKKSVGISSVGLLFGKINNTTLDEGENALFVGLTLSVGENTAGIAFRVQDVVYVTDERGEVVVLLGNVNSTEDTSVVYANEYIQAREIALGNGLYQTIRLPKRITLATDNITDNATEDWLIRVRVIFFGEYEDIFLDYSDVDLALIGEELVYDYVILESYPYNINLSVTLYRYSEEMIELLTALDELETKTEGSNIDFYNWVQNAVYLYEALNYVYLTDSIGEESKYRYIQYIQDNNIGVLLDEWSQIVASGEDISSIFDIQYNTQEGTKQIIIHTLYGDITYLARVSYEYMASEARAIATISPILLRKGNVVTYTLPTNYEVEIERIVLPSLDTLTDYVRDVFVYDATSKARASIDILTAQQDVLTLELVASEDTLAGEYKYYASQMSGAKSAYYVLPDNYYVGELVINKRPVWVEYQEGQFEYNGQQQGVVPTLAALDNYNLQEGDYGIWYKGYTYTNSYYQEAYLPYEAGYYKVVVTTSNNFLLQGVSEINFEIIGERILGEPNEYELDIDIQDVVYGCNLDYSVSAVYGVLQSGDYIIRFLDGDNYVMQPVSVGAYTLEVVPTNINHTFTNNTKEFCILPRELSLDYPKVLVYSGEIQKPYPVLLGVLGEDSVVLECEYYTPESIGEGLYFVDITLSGKDKDNYYLADSLIEYLISKKEYFATFAKTEFLYGELKDIGLKVVDYLERITFEYDIEIMESGTSLPTIPNKVGSYLLTIIPHDSNIKIHNNTTTITVSKADIDNIKLFAKTYVFDGQKHSVEVSTFYLPDGRLASVSYSNNGQTNKGEYTVTATVSDEENCYNSLSLSTILTIKPRKITHNVFVDEYVYNKLPQGPSYISAEFVELNGGYNTRYVGIDNAYNSSTAPTLAGQYTLRLTAVESSIEIVGGEVEFCIQKQYVQVDMSTAYQVVYGGNQVSYPHTVIGVIGRDSVSASLSYNGESIAYNAGSYLVYVEGLVGESANNYYTDIRYRAYSLVITPCEITVTANSISTTYGENSPPLTYSLSRELLGVDTFIGMLIRDTGESVGNYEIMQGTLTAGSNYTITFENALYTIKPRVLEVIIEDNMEYTGLCNYPTVTIGNILPQDTAKAIYSIAYIGNFCDAGMYSVAVRSLNINYVVKENLSYVEYEVELKQRNLTSYIKLDIPTKVYASDNYYPQPIIIDTVTNYIVNFYTITIFDNTNNTMVNNLSQKGQYRIVIDINELNYCGQGSFAIEVKEKVLDVPTISKGDLLIRHNSVRITNSELELSLDNIVWGSNILENLTEDTEYRLYVRYKEGVNSANISFSTPYNPQRLHTVLSTLPQKFEWQHLQLLQSVYAIISNTSELEYDVADLTVYNQLIKEYNTAFDKLNNEINRAKIIADRVTGGLNLHTAVMELSMLLSYICIGLFVSKGGVL